MGVQQFQSSQFNSGQVAGAEGSAQALDSPVPIEEVSSKEIGGALEMAFTADSKLLLKRSEHSVQLLAAGSWSPVFEATYRERQVVKAEVDKEGRRVLVLTTPPPGARFVRCDIWGVKENAVLGSFDDYDGVPSIAFAALSPKGDCVALASRDKDVIQLIDAVSGKRITTLHHGGQRLHIQFNPAGQLASTNGTETQLFDATTGQSIGKFPQAGAVADGPPLFDASGRIVVPTVDGFDIYDSKTHELIWRNDTVLAGGRYQVTNDGSVVLKGNSVSGVSDSAGHIWNTKSRQKIAERIPLQINQPELDPLGRCVVLTGSGGNIGIWSIESGRQLIKAKESSVWMSGCFSHDGKWIVVGDTKRAKVVLAETILNRRE